MKLLLLGSTGKAGSVVLGESLQRGHHVTVLVRTPEKVVLKHKNLTILQGDALDLNVLATALPGHEAIISCLSPGTIKRTDVQKRFAKCITEAMLTVGVQRLVSSECLLRCRLQIPVSLTSCSTKSSKTTMCIQQLASPHNGGR